MKKALVLCIGLALSGCLMAQKYGSSPEDSTECIKNLSIYQEFFKQKAYTEAYDAWKDVLKYCPANSLNTYIRGNTILKQVIAKESDATKKAEYVDELLNLWDLRSQYFGRPGYCLGMKGQDLRTYRPSEIMQAKELFSSAMNYQDEKGVYPVPFWYLGCIVDAFKANLAQKEEIFEAYDKAVAMLEYIKAKDAGDTNIDNALAGCDALLEPFASCEDLINIYGKKFEENKSNIDFLKKATKMLDNRSCTDSELFFKATEALHSLEPTPQSAYLMAKMCYAKKEYKQAIDYISKEVDNLEKDSEKINSYMLLADSYMNTSQYSLGKDACNKALAINPNEGRVYLMIGHLYAAGAKLCGDDAVIGQRAAFWAAVDKYNKAKQVDPSVAEAANKFIAAYQAYFPSGDDIFTHGLKEGDSYTIQCWFSETTTIRARK